MHFRIKIGHLNEIRSETRVTVPMPVKIFLKKFSFQLFACLLCFPVFPSIASDDPHFASWQKLETKHTIITYKTNEDLATFNTCLEFDQNRWSLKQLFTDIGTDTPADELGMKVDNIHERVQEILDMRKQFPKVTINIYPDRKQMDEAFFRIYQRKNKIRAWYIFEKNTIYVNVDDLNEGLLAHEMAHSIIDHFLLIRPPAASSEILARYVDSHINR